jgi:hypothetical protein
MPKPQPREPGPYRGKFPRKQLSLFKIVFGRKGKHRRGKDDPPKKTSGGGGFHYR